MTSNRCLSDDVTMRFMIDAERDGGITGDGCSLTGFA
jgi:hypothetical protein